MVRVDGPQLGILITNPESFDVLLQFLITGEVPKASLALPIFIKIPGHFIRLLTEQIHE